MRGTENDGLTNYVFYYDTNWRVLAHPCATGKLQYCAWFVHERFGPCLWPS